MDLSCYEMELVTKTTALLFLPFTTKVIYFDCLFEMLADFFQPPFAPSVQLPVPGRMPMDQIDIYVGGASNHRLGNLFRFLQYNELDVVNVGTSYSIAIVVGRNSSSGVYVDVPISANPWVSERYGASFDMRLFNTLPNEVQSNEHRLLAVCGACKTLRKRCVRNGLSCVTCDFVGSECVPGIDEAQRRRWESAAYTRSNVDMLCALHQYTINLFLRANASFLLSADEVKTLGSMLDAQTTTIQNVHVESALKTYSDAFQEVSIYMGLVQVIDNRNDENLWGFEVGMGFTKSKDVRSVISPHLGMANPSDACGLIDSALNSPGDMFFRDMCILDRGFKPRSVRIMVLGAVISPRHIEIVIGWKFP